MQNKITKVGFRYFKHLFSTPLSEEELLALVKRKPAIIKNYPHASESLQMACVEADPSCVTFIHKPTNAVLSKAYSKQYRLIENNPSPTVEQQMAAVNNNWFAIYSIKNPCREAVLVVLKQCGAYLKTLSEKQVEFKEKLVATQVPLHADVALQAAALSDISGVMTYLHSPELFDDGLLEEVHPGITTMLKKYQALGLDEEDTDQFIEHELARVKENRPAVAQSTITLPAWE